MNGPDRLMADHLAASDAPWIALRIRARGGADMVQLPAGVEIVGVADNGFGLWVKFRRDWAANQHHPPPGHWLWHYL